MGVINFGIPQAEAVYLKNKLGLSFAIEGGTFLGGTARFLAAEFDSVYTIEKSDVMYAEAKRNLLGVANVDLLQGDTREHLEAISAVKDNCLFWLDSHWSGGDTYGEGDECPLLEELKVLFASPMQNYAILIDDARLFLAPPPKPHDFEAWPGLRELFNVIPTEFDFIVHDDVIFLTPKRIDFPRYLQSVITDQVRSSSPNTVLSKMKSYVKKVIP